MSQWYLKYPDKEIGPFTLSQTMFQISMNPGAMARQDPSAPWIPVNQIKELGGTPPPEEQPGPSLSQEPMPSHSQQNINQVEKIPPSSVTFNLKPQMPKITPMTPSNRTSDEVDFQLFGAEMQFVEVELDPGESAIAEAGAMMYKDNCIEMETIFGDGSKSSAGKGIMNKLLGAGKRLLTGESLFITIFTHAGHHGKAHVAFAAPYPGNIIPVSLAHIGGSIICQKDSFLCAARGVTIGIYFQRKILTGLFGGEGFIMQKLEGDGMAFIHAGGTVIERVLSSGEELHVDTGCVVAFEPSINFDIKQVGSIKTAFFGGEGLFFAVLRGPGKVWLQSLPFSRLAGRMLSAVPTHKGGKGRHAEEGSILGSLGDLFDGDNK